MLGNDTVGHRVGTKESNAPLHDCFVFLRRTLHPVIRREFRKIRTRVDDSEVTTAVEYRDALRIRAKEVNRTAFGSRGSVRFESPGADQVFGGLSGSTGQGDPQAGDG